MEAAEAAEEAAAVAAAAERLENKKRKRNLGLLSFGEEAEEVPWPLKLFSFVCFLLSVCECGQQRKWERMASGLVVSAASIGCSSNSQNQGL